MNQSVGGTRRDPSRHLAPKPSSLRPIDPTSLSQDEALTGIPAQFVKDVLKDLAPRLLSGINCTSLDPASTPAPDKELPTHAHCTFNPSLAPGSSPLCPNFLLALTFPPRDPSISLPARILVPCHSLVYTLSSPLFPYIASPPSTPTSEEPTNENDSPVNPSSLLLPVMGPIELPSLHAFSVLHTFLHNRSTSSLQHSLTTKLPSTSRLPSPPPSPRIDPQNSTSLIPTPTLAQLNWEEAQELLDKIQDLRRTAIKLEVSDPALWQTMSNSWQYTISQIP